MIKDILKKCSKILPDKIYLKIKYLIKLKKFLNLKKPQTFNEKIQWLKLYDRKKIYTTMVDKYEVKKYVSNIIGEKYIIPTIGIYDSFDDIDFDTIPNQFVIKCTHDSGGVVIVDDKSKFDKATIRKKINKHLKDNYYYAVREWPYKLINPRIIIEKYMVDESGYELKDYKIFCFGGKAKYIQVDFNRFKNHRKNIYDLDWNLLDVEINYPNDVNHYIEKPKMLDEMIKNAEILSKGIKFIRVDFYSIGQQLFFGELTFYPGSGFMPFKPEIWDKKFGEFIDL